jgi:hypothetical protein
LYCSAKAPDEGVYFAATRAKLSAWARIAVVMAVYVDEPATIVVGAVRAGSNCWKKGREIEVTLIPCPRVSQTWRAR